MSERKNAYTRVTGELSEPIGCCTTVPTNRYKNNNPFHEKKPNTLPRLKLDKNIQDYR